MELLGKYIMVKTQTKDGNFGDCLYQISGPIVEVEQLGVKQRRIKCEMLGGSGPSAHHGRVVWDVVEELEAAIASGKTHRLVSSTEVLSLMQTFENKTKKPGNIIELG